MRFDLQTGGTAVSIELGEGTFTLGGDETDDVRVSGLPSFCARLFVECDHWCICAQLALHVSSVPLYAEVRRLVLPGEKVRLPGGSELWSDVAPPSPDIHAETSALLKECLGGGAAFPTPALTCLTGLDLGHVYPLGPEPMRIGREDVVEVRLRDRFVSRVHARIEPREGVHWLSDVGSANPLSINGLQVEAPHVLQDGDIIALGFSHLRYSRPRAPPASDPPEVAVRAANTPLTKRTTPDTFRELIEPANTKPFKRASLSRQKGQSTEWPWMAAGATLVALGAYLGIAGAL